MKSTAVSMSAPGANCLPLRNRPYGFRHGRSVLQISCAIMLVEWFNGTGQQAALFAERGPSAGARQ